MPGGSIGVRQDRATVRVYDMLACVASASRLLEALSRFASQVNIDTASASSIALFRGPHIDDDRQVEALPWESREVREVHAADGQPWAPDLERREPHCTRLRCRVVVVDDRGGVAGSDRATIAARVVVLTDWWWPSGALPCVGR